MRRQFFVIITLLLCVSAKSWISNFNQDISFFIYNNGDKIVNNTYRNEPGCVESPGMGSARLDLEIPSDGINVYRYTTAKGKERITRFIPAKLVGNYSLTEIGSQGSLGVNINNGVVRRLNIISVYPNPVDHNNTIYIDVDADNELLNDLTLNIYNSLGQLVRHMGISANSTRIDTSDMTPSTYIFVLQGKKGFNKEFKVVIL